MSRDQDRKEALRAAAEKVKKQKEEEKRKEKEYYQRITSGPTWLFFKFVVVFCSLMAILTTVETFVDGETRKLDDSEWRVDRELYVLYHQSVKVGDDLFVPHLDNWIKYKEGTFEITYSPIFHTGKKLSYDLEVDEDQVRRHQVIRRRSVFTWFPYVQLLMIIPLLTFLFKAQQPWFNFARVASLALIFPGTLMILFYTLL